jgi:UDP-2,4-diacetamido-2,4,6-trideoxy-beta-L-altropyranose hydrolase
MDWTENSSLVFRVDGGASIGTGHVMRCLALAQAWRDSGGAARFVTAQPLGALEERVGAEGFQVLYANFVSGSIADARATVAAARQSGAPWIIADGYHFGPEYQQAIKDTGIFLLFIDDYGHGSPYCADLVLNQNLYASDDLYRDRAPYTQRLLGTKYALLRREFLKYREGQRDFPQIARRILVTLGGADAANVTQKVVDALKRLSDIDLEIKIVAGAANTHVASLRETAAQANGCIEVLSAVTDVPKLMAWADLAISAGGTTCWEIAFMGLPACIIVLADNQMPVARALDEKGAAINVGRWGGESEERFLDAVGNLIYNRDRRRAMGRIGRTIVDGKGAERVTARLREQTTSYPVSIAQER